MKARSQQKKLGKKPRKSQDARDVVPQQRLAQHTQPKFSRPLKCSGLLYPPRKPSALSLIEAQRYKQKLQAESQHEFTLSLYRHARTYSCRHVSPNPPNWDLPTLNIPTSFLLCDRHRSKKRQPFLGLPPPARERDQSQKPLLHAHSCLSATSFAARSGSSSRSLS